VTFDEILEQALEMLQRRGRVSYRALKVQFQLDDDLLEILEEDRPTERRVLFWHILQKFSTINPSIGYR